MKSKPRAGRTGPAGRNNPALRAQGTVVTKPCPREREAGEGAAGEAEAGFHGESRRTRGPRDSQAPRSGGEPPRRRPPSAGWTALASQPFPVLPQVGIQNAVNGHISFFTLITKQYELLSGTVQAPPPPPVLGRPLLTGAFPARRF